MITVSKPVKFQAQPKYQHPSQAARNKGQQWKLKYVSHEFYIVNYTVYDLQ